MTRGNTPNSVPRLLITYTTNAGSTKEVAERIAAHIDPGRGTVETIPADQVEDLSAYEGVVVGGPMILGWHRRVRRFYRKHRRELRNIPHHLFMTAMRVTDSGDPGVVTIDPGIVVRPQDQKKMSLKERLTTAEHYIEPIAGEAGGGLLSIGIFGGKLDYTKLKLFQMLFVMLVVGEAPGEKRNWKLIEEWAGNLRFNTEEE